MAAAGCVMETSILNFAPDIETSSEAYSRRFQGELGDYFLSVQSSIVDDFLNRGNLTIQSVLDVGGGHGQLVPLLLGLGLLICIHGSSEECFRSIRAKINSHADRLRTAVSPMHRLPFKDREFDVVVSIRTLAHAPDWQEFLTELCRVSRKRVIFDYPPVYSFNITYPLFFRIKKLIEGDTRPFERFTADKLRPVLESEGFGDIQIEREFFLPMALHRLLKSPRLSRWLESFFAKLGLTRLLGSPAILCATRK